MKKIMMTTMALVFALTVALVGTGSAGIFSSDKAETESDQAVLGEQLTLSGTIDANSQFVDDQGQVFALADNEKSLEVKSLQGQKVEIKGTVMEEAGQKTVVVTEYTIQE
jgi:hypothetical protein